MVFLKPKCKYRTIKCPLKSIINNDLDMTKLIDVMMRTHKIVIHTYHFLRLWILRKCRKKLDIPIIDVGLIKMAFKSLVTKSTGPKPRGDNLKLYNEFIDFYDSKYKKLNYETKIDGNNLSGILKYMATDMLTNIENNIKMNFIKYVKRFVNSSFKIKNNELLEKCEKGTKTKLKKELNKNLYDIKEDLLNNTLDSDVANHEWINKHRANIFPAEFKHSYDFDIQHNPQNYIKPMIYMCSNGLCPSRYARFALLTF